MSRELVFDVSSVSDHSFTCMIINMCTMNLSDVISRDETNGVKIPQRYSARFRGGWRDVNNEILWFQSHHARLRSKMQR